MIGGLRALLLDEHAIGIVVLLVLGAGAAFLAGRAIADNWRPWWQAVVSALLLGLAVRFLHFALFGGSLSSPLFYAFDASVCVAAALLGYRLMRVRQMVTAYGWLNARRGLFGWRRQAATPERPGELPR